jgi:hypothetical protein
MSSGVFDMVEKIRETATVHELDDLADYIGDFEAHISNGRLIAGKGLELIA